MATERKTMVSLRLPNSLLKRVDFVAGNTGNKAIASRSAVITAAIEEWLPPVENELASCLKALGAPSTRAK